MVEDNTEGGGRTDAPPRPPAPLGTPLLRPVGKEGGGWGEGTPHGNSLLGYLGAVWGG